MKTNSTRIFRLATHCLKSHNWGIDLGKDANQCLRRLENNLKSKQISIRSEQEEIEDMQIVSQKSTWKKSPLIIRLQNWRIKICVLSLDQIKLRGMSFDG